VPARHRFLFLGLAILWLALRIPFFGARFSFNWDSSQYARGMTEFNVFKHQPHPPGYLLWVLSARILEPLAGGAMRAQIIVAFVMTLLALAIFYFLALRILDSQVSALTCTALLAYAPGVALNSSISSPSITDLVSSLVAGYLAFLDPHRRQWRIVACLAALGLLAGFHQSNLALLAPLVAVAAISHWRHAWRPVCTGAILGTLAFLAWYVPLANSVGGSSVLSHLTSIQFHDAASKSSVFYGAPLRNHLSMTLNNVIYSGMNLAPWLVAFGLPFVWQRKTVPGWWRYALWMIPTLIMLLGIHSGRVGYWLIAFPPLLLLCAIGGRVRMPATIAAVLLSLAISYFPYGRLQFSKIAPVSYVFYRSAPRMALDLEASQRNLDQTLHQLLQSGVPQPFVCARDIPEAPNIRTVTYDFAYVNWILPEAAPASRSIWLFDQHGPDAEIRKHYQTWRQIVADDLWSLWQATSPQPPVPSP
jgi:hypothetical protein